MIAAVTRRSGVPRMRGLCFAASFPIAPALDEANESFSAAVRRPDCRGAFPIRDHRQGQDGSPAEPPPVKPQVDLFRGDRYKILRLCCWRPNHATALSAWLQDTGDLVGKTASVPPLDDMEAPAIIHKSTDFASSGRCNTSATCQSIVTPSAIPRCRAIRIAAALKSTPITEYPHVAKKIASRPAPQPTSRATLPRGVSAVATKLTNSWTRAYSPIPSDMSRMNTRHPIRRSFPHLCVLALCVWRPPNLDEKFAAAELVHDSDFMGTVRCAM